jgi:hypothetical protein
MNLPTRRIGDSKDLEQSSHERWTRTTESSTSTWEDHPAGRQPLGQEDVNQEETVARVGMPQGQSRVGVEPQCYRSSHYKSLLARRVTTGSTSFNGAGGRSSLWRMAREG